MSTTDDISPNLTKLLADAIHKKQVFERLLTDFDQLVAEYQLEPGDINTLRNAMQHPPAAFEVNLPVFLDALHKQGFVQLSWVGFRRFH